MKQKNCLALPSPLESVQYQFEKWRETKTHTRESIPEYLWETASKLHNAYSINHISKTLRLNYADLKKRILGQKPDRQKKDQASPLLVEMDCFQSFTTSECIIEMEDAGGSKMRMTFKGKTDLDLLELGKTFWRKGK